MPLGVFSVHFPQRAFACCDEFLHSFGASEFHFHHSIGQLLRLAAQRDEKLGIKVVFLAVIQYHLQGSGLRATAACTWPWFTYFLFGSLVLLFHANHCFIVGGNQFVLGGLKRLYFLLAFAKALQS